MARHVAVEVLVEHLQEQEARGRLGRGDGAFAEPEDAGNVLGQHVDGVFADIDGLCNDVVVAEISGQFEVAVVDGACGVDVQNEFRGDSCGELVSPQVGCDAAFGVGCKEHTAHSNTRGVAGDHDRGWRRDELGDACWACVELFHWESK